MRGVSISLDLAESLAELFDLDKGECTYCGGLTGHCTGCPGQELLEALRKREARLQARRETLRQALGQASNRNLMD